MIEQILTKHDRKIVVAIILLASGLRFVGLGARSLWFDEALSIKIARLDAATILTTSGGSGHPPGFYFLLYLWRAAGEGDFWLRFPSAFFSVLSVALTYGLARYLFDRPMAQVSAFWMAISPFQLYYAQEVRMYAMTTAVILGLMWGFFHGVREEGKKGWLAYGALSVLGLHTYYFVGFVMAALSLWWLLDRCRWKTFGMFLITNGVAALASAPQLIRYISQTNSILAAAISRGSASTGLVRPNVLSSFTTLYHLLFSHVFPPKLFWAALGFFCVVGMLALSMLLWARGHHVSRLRRSAVKGLLLVIWIPILFSLIFSWIFRSIYIERSFVICAPSLVLLFAFGALESPKLSPTPYVAAGFTLLLILGAVFYVVRPDPVKPPIRDAVATVAERMQEGDVSLHLQAASYLPALIYTPVFSGALLDVGQPLWGSKAGYQASGGDVVTLDEALSGASRLWLTVMPGYNDESQRVVAKSIAAQYVLLEVWDWGQIQLYLYELSNCEQPPIGQRRTSHDGPQ